MSNDYNVEPNLTSACTSSPHATETIVGHTHPQSYRDVNQNFVVTKNGQPCLMKVTGTQYNNFVGQTMNPVTFVLLCDAAAK